MAWTTLFTEQRSEYPILGIPLVYDFDEHMTPIRHYYLKDDETVASAIRTAINETKLDPQPCI